MNTVGGAWAVLKGRRTGSVQDAEGFLNSMSPEVRGARNRAESRSKIRVRARRRLKGMGQHGRRQS
jgi:hypothetical protein